MTLFAAGVLNGALYLAAVLGAGLSTAHAGAWKLSIAAMGVTYLCYLAQCATARPAFVMALSVVSIALGAVAGLALLF